MPDIDELGVEEPEAIDPEAIESEAIESEAVSMAKLTVIRCTTLTQLPVLFCAGSSENSEPVPGVILLT